VSLPELVMSHIAPIGAESQRTGIVRITGRYRLPSDIVSELRHVLAGDPRAVLLDLSEMSGNPRLLFEVLDPVAAYLAAWPGTVVVVCVPGGEESAPLLPLPISDRVLLARADEDGLQRAYDAIPQQDRSTTFLTPEPQASDVARAFTRHTLREWQLDALIWPASLVVSELVTHSILRAQTVLDLTLSRVDHRVRIAVRDYGADHMRVTQAAEPIDPLEDPLLDRGLLVVRALTRAWGAFPSRVHGKTVWAVLEAA
jgi:anti-sigma regulatory factor (Ser/Thr protein kinase)